MLKSLKITLCIALLSLLVWVADPTKLLVTLQQVSIQDFAVLMLLSFVMISVSAFKWQLFITFLGAHVRFMRLCALYLTGYFVNIIFPSYIGGDAMRSYYVGKSVGQHQALSATLLERYTGFLAMVILGTIAAIYEDRLIGINVRILVVGMGIGAIGITVIACYVRLNPERFKNKFLKKIALTISRLHELMLLTAKQPSLWIKAMGISFFYHILTVANTYIAAVAVGWDNPPITELFVVLPIILILGSLPITPSGLGIQEGAFFHFLQILGASSPQALGVAVLLRAKTYVLAFLGWLVWSFSGAKKDLANFKLADIDRGN